MKIFWKGLIANHSFVAILPSLHHLDLQGVWLRLNAAKRDMNSTCHTRSTTSIGTVKVLRGELEVLAMVMVVKKVRPSYWEYQNRIARPVTQSWR